MKRVKSWWARKRCERYRRWLRYNKVLMPLPHHSCERDKTQAVP